LEASIKKQFSKTAASIPRTVVVGTRNPAHRHRRFYPDHKTIYSLLEPV